MKKLNKKSSAAASQQVTAYCYCTCSGCGATTYNTTFYKRNTGARY